METATFCYKDLGRNFPVGTLTPHTLSLIFELDRDNITLMDVSDGTIFVQKEGLFVGLQNGRKYEVFCEVLKKAVAEKVKLEPGDHTLMLREASTITSDILDKVDGAAKAVTAVSMIDTLTILTSCTADISLENEKSKKIFKKLKAQGSLRASLVQVIVEATRAFHKADSINDKINTSLARLPSILIESVDAAGNSSDPASVKILDKNKKSIDRIVEQCAKDAEEVAAAFKNVSETISEILEAATATQSFSEEQKVNIKRQQEEYKAQQDLLEKESANLQEKIKKQDEMTEEAMAFYKQRAGIMGTLGTLFVACMYEGISKVGRAVLQNQAAFAALAGPGVGAVGGIAGAAGGIAGLVGAAGPTIKTIAQLVKNSSEANEAQEAGVICFVEAYWAQGLPSEEDMRSKAGEHKECFDSLRKSCKPVTETGKLLLKKVEDYVKLCTAIQENGFENKTYEKLSNCLDAMKKLAAAARQEQDQIHRKRSEAEEGCARILEQTNEAARDSHTHYMEQRNLADILHKQGADFRSQLADLGQKLKNSKSEIVDLEEVIKYLAIGFTILNQLHGAWLAQVQFFESIKNTVSGPVKETLRLFIVERNIRVSYPESESAKKILLKTAMMACSICFQIIHCTGIYKCISSKYVIPQITNTTANLQLERGEARDLLAKNQQTYKDNQTNVLAVINEKKLEMGEEVQKQIAEYIQRLVIIET